MADLIATRGSDVTSQRAVPLVVFVAVTYLVTWGALAPLVLAGAASGPLSPGAVGLFLVASISPSLVAMALCLFSGGPTSLLDLLTQAGRWRFGVRWYVVALGLPSLLALLALGLGQLIEPIPLQVNALAVAALVPIAPLGEEFGWRGFALPQLLKRTSPLAASLVLGVLWGAWHLPIFLLQGFYPAPLWASFGLFVLVVVAESVFIGWVYEKTGGSLLSALVFHQGIRIAALVPMGAALGSYALFALVHGGAAILVGRFGLTHGLAAPKARHAERGARV